MYKFLGNFAILVAVVGLLATSFGVWSMLHHHHGDAYEIKAKSDVHQLGGEIALYQKDYGRYPESLDVLIGDYLQKKAKDPWGNDYEYITDGKKAIIFTKGSGKPNSNQIFHVEVKEI